MLLCAVSAMVLIAAWSMERDELAGPAAATGLLALRNVSQRAVERKEGRAATPRRAADSVQRPRKRATQPQVAAAAANAAGKPKAQSFNTREMMEIAREVEDHEIAPQRADRVGF